ncbi:MAG: hypothetical protein ACRC6E_01030 [Fusobacteriaceae bacterium]
MIIKAGDMHFEVIFDDKKINELKISELLKTIKYTIYMMWDDECEYSEYDDPWVRIRYYKKVTLALGYVIDFQRIEDLERVEEL